MSRFGYTKRTKELRRKAKREAKQERKRKRQEGLPPDDPSAVSDSDPELSEAMSTAGPVTSAELAKSTGKPEPYVHGWLVAQTDAGFLTYDDASDRYSLQEEEEA